MQMVDLQCNKKLSRFSRDEYTNMFSILIKKATIVNEGTVERRKKDVSDQR